MTETGFLNMLLREAGRFVGLRETVSNRAWDKPSTAGSDKALSDELRGLMRPAPWEDGWAYCAAFTEGMVVVALRRLGMGEKEIARFAKLHGPHVMSNVRAFKAAGLLSQVPVPGALWLAQHGTSDRGHEGIVVGFDEGRMATIEANTSAGADVPAKEREGDWITNRVRNPKSNGILMTRGFVTPAAILKLVTGS
jgi:hypothetical protein